MRNVRGFTLMEVIGVMAVIAIIAAIATPQIFQAIEDARVTSLVQDTNQIRASVTRYYKDTGTWPRHIPSHAENRYKNLMINDNNGTPINGWDGPYLEQELRNPITPGGYVDVLVTSDSRYACDLDGDGTGDGQFLVYRVDGVSDEVARKVSNTIDQDGIEESGTTSWKTAGRVKRYNGNHASILLICLSRV